MTARIEEVNCFKMLISESLFVGELSEIAERVQEKIREFCLQEMQILLGMRKAKVDQQFSDPEIQALKHLAGLTLKAKGIKVSSSPVLAQTKVPVQPQQPSPPQLRLRQQFSGPDIKEEKAVQPQSLPATPVERVKKKGRPSKVSEAGPKVTKVKSTVGIRDLNTGEMIYPVLEIKEPPKALSGAQPLPMPSLQQIYSQGVQMNAGGQQMIMATGSNVNGNEAQATMDLALAASLRK